MNPVNDYSSKIINVTGQDAFNYLANAYASNHQLHMTLHFNGYVCEKLLEQSILCTIDLQPVLKCRFVEHSIKSFWEEIGNNPSFFEYYLVSETESTEQKVRDFISLPSDSRYDPLIQVRLLRSTTNDTLCIKLDHACIDGAGVKQYAYLLGNIYNSLLESRTFFTPQLLARRDCFHYLSRLGINDPREAWDPSQTTSPPNWGFPTASYQHSQSAFISRKISAEQYHTLMAYSKENSVTITDILLTAFYRALFTMTEAPENDLRPMMVTVDLRKFLSEEEKSIVANMSSSYNVQLSFIHDEPFTETLKRVSTMMNNQKVSRAEIPIAVIMEIFGYLNFHEVQNWYEQSRQFSLATGFSTPLLSNIGIIDPIRFGEVVVTDAYVVTPAMYAPGLMLGASTYNNVLTLMINYYVSEIQEADIHELLNRMLHDIPRTVSVLK